MEYFKEMNLRFCYLNFIVVGQAYLCKPSFFLSFLEDIRGHKCDLKKKS